MFCLAQLGCITAGILCAYKGMRLQVLFLEEWGRPIEVSATARFLVSYGWLLLLIPIACVLLIPRHREDESSDDAEWRWRSITVAAAGVAAMAFSPAVGIVALFSSFSTR